MSAFKLADLFCGAGGTSTGAVEALEALGHEPELTAVNHWPVAVATHTANHPGARHFCVAIDDLNPRHLYGEGELDLLWASPECTHHSVARGGKPINDQSRATAWCVTRWAEALRPGVICVENVPEFLSWGPIGSNNRPLESRKGELFHAWVATLEACGYKVGWRVLVAADYGDPTTRRRLFVQAVRGRRKVCWPEPTHAREQDLFGGRLPWVAAREIIDWDLPTPSIFRRERPLAPKTLARIYEGLKRFGLGGALVCMEHKGSVRPLDVPVPTVTTARGGAMGVARPYLVKVNHGGKRDPRSVDAPLPTVCGHGEWGLCEPKPFLVQLPEDGEAQPYLVSYYGNGGAMSVDDPVDTVTTRDRFALVQPRVQVAGEEYLVDIGFRMLQPHELAAAQGFRRGYQFTGSKVEQVKQIGNAVPRNLARAIVAAAVGQKPDVSWLWRREVAA